MFGVGPATRIYLAAGATDLRKNFEGLYGMVRDRLSCDPLSGHIFLFTNAQRNRLKLLFWDGSGPVPVAGLTGLTCAKKEAPWLEPLDPMTNFGPGDRCVRRHDKLVRIAVSDDQDAPKPFMLHKQPIGVLR
jgi:hypothetical protein